MTLKVGYSSFKLDHYYKNSKCTQNYRLKFKPRHSKHSGVKKAAILIQ